jgi:hypothetical protein
MYHDIVTIGTLNHGGGYSDFLCRVEKSIHNRIRLYCEELFYFEIIVNLLPANCSLALKKETAFFRSPVREEKRVHSAACLNDK